MAGYGLITCILTLWTMVMRLVQFAALVVLSLSASTAEAALLAWIVSQVAIDQPSLGLLVQAWGQ